MKFDDVNIHAGSMEMYHIAVDIVCARLCIEFQGEW